MSILLVSSCIGTKHLEGNQKILYQQTLKLPKGISSEGLRELFVQKINARIKPTAISVPVTMYYVGQKNFKQETFFKKRTRIEKKYDRKIAATQKQKKIATLQYHKQNKVDALNKKIDNGNWFMQWGEPLTIFDSLAMTQTQEKLKNKLFNEGYFHVKVSSSCRSLKKRRTRVEYKIFTDHPFLYDTISLDIPDQKIEKIILKNQSNSFIKKGDVYNQNKLGKERDRIDQLLKDNGFYNFSKQFIDFIVDTTSVRGKIRLQMEILNPAKLGYHQQFKLDSIIFTPDVGVKGKENLRRQSSFYHNVTFNRYDVHFNQRLLAQRVFISKDSLYSKTQTINTQRQLANLDHFKFVNINYDTTGGRFIANLFTSPSDRYTWSNETGVTVTQGFPGPYISSNFKVRNIFGGLEIFEINGRFGFEGVAAVTSTSGFYRSTEATGNASITLPQFLFPFKNAAQFRHARNNPRTKLLGGYTYTDRPEYQRSIATLSATYTWDLNRRWIFSFSPVTVNIINSTLTKSFNDTLQALQKRGNNLINAFKPSYVSSMIFTLTWNDNYGVAKKNSTYVRASFESGGTLLNVYSPKLIENQGLETYKYLRLSFDFRKNIVLSKTMAFAYRFNSGFGFAYGTNKVMPYEKNFFAGGSNSIRAWRPRRLGLGSDPPAINSNPTNNGYFNYSIEKPGQVLFEGSVEWRQKLVGFLNYALFIDAGNVWGLQISNNNPANFSWNKFYQQFAVGSGFGLRFDFTFLILRFDVGMKVWDPARNPGSQFVLPKASFRAPYVNHEPVIYNIGIGYPF